MDLKAIKERAEKATPGPWEWLSYGDGFIQLQGQTECSEMNPVIVPYICDTCASRKAKCLSGSDEDRTFIAHAREDIPALLAEVERLQMEIDVQIRCEN